MFKSLNEGKQTKKTRLKKSVVNCRGSLAWLGRQTHNLGSTTKMRHLETINGAKRLLPEVAGSNPVPGTTFISQSSKEVPNKLQLFFDDYHVGSFSNIFFWSVYFG
jgi:hypothetical protein